uniref:uncharacterized protein n=1 Tax=Myxine glutinosa TaxID=7769 RepID=UPI00358FB7AF
MQQLQVTTQADTAETPAPLVAERKKRGGSGRRTTDEQSHRVQACRITAYATQGTRVGQGFAKACADSVIALKSTEVSASAEESVGCPPPQQAEAPDSLATPPIVSDVPETSSDTKGFCGSPCSSPKPQRVQTPPPCDLPSTKPTPCSLSPASIPGPGSSSPKPAHQNQFKSAQQDLPSPMNAQPPCGSPKLHKASPCHSPKTSQTGSPKREPCKFHYPCKGDTVSPQILSPHVAQQHGKQAHYGIGRGAMDTFIAGLGGNQRANTAAAGHGYPGWRSRTARGTGKRHDVLNASRLCHSILKFQPSYQEAVQAVCTNRGSNSAASPGEALAGTSTHASLPRKLSEGAAVGSKFVASSRRQSCGRSTDATTEFNRAVSSAQATLAAAKHPVAQADAAFGKRERVLPSRPCSGGTQYILTTTNRRASIGDMYARSGAILGRLGRENFTQGQLRCGTRNMHMPAAAMTLQRSRSHHSTGPIATTFPQSWCGPGCCHCRTESPAFRSRPGARSAQPWFQQHQTHEHLHTCYH